MPPLESTNLSTDSDPQATGDLSQGEVFVFPTTVAQRRFWLLDQFKPGNPGLNVPLAARLNGRIDRSLLEEAVNEVLRRHEILRTSFRSLGDEAVQVVQPERTIRLDWYDVSECPESEREGRAQQVVLEEGLRPFVLTEGPLLRAGLIKIREEEHILLLTMHHIGCDGWSNGVLIPEVAQIYSRRMTGEADLPELPLQYADFAVWQKEWLESPAAEEQKHFWKTRLAGVLPVLNLPTDRPRHLGRANRGFIHTLLLPRRLSEALKGFCTREGITPFMLYFATYAVLLYRYSGRTRILIGTPAANRSQTDLEGLIGLFANPLILPIDLSGRPSFRTLIGRVKDLSLEAFTHQAYPFEKVIEEIETDPTRAGVPWLQAYFIFQKAFMLPQQLPNATLTPLRSVSSGSMFEWCLGVLERSEGIRLQLEYDTDLYDQATIDRVLHQFQHLLELSLTHPDSVIDELQILTSGEYQNLVVNFNRTGSELARERCVHELFEEQTRRSPDALAVVGDGLNLSYSELNSRANRLAHYLRRLGLGPGSRIGLAADCASIEFLIGFLGILKFGGCCVVLDTTKNAKTLSVCLGGSALAGLVVGPQLPASLPPCNLPTISFVTDANAIASEASDDPLNVAQAEQPASIQFSSGRTQALKGVILTHAALLNGAVATHRELALLPEDRVGLTINEMLPGLIAGAALVLPLRVGSEFQAEPWLEWACAHRVTVAALPTGCWNELLHTLSRGVTSWKGMLRVMMIGGGRISRAAWSAWRIACGERVRLLNRYLLTECVGAAAWSELGPDRDPSRLNSFSQPSMNSRLYVLDGNLQPVPIGVPGDVYLGGQSLASGYIVAPDAAGQNALADRFLSKEGEPLFKTGDRGRFLTGGAVELIGRQEDLEKTNGFQLELNDLRSVLCQHPAIWDIELIPEEKLGEKRLGAYVVPKADVPLTGAELRGFLKERLPEYMVPTGVVVLGRLPLSSDGRVDRRSVPALAALGRESQGPVDYVAPRTRTEQLLCGIWCEVLGLKQVGINDSFFALGGHSLVAVRLFSQIEKVTGRRLPLVTLLEARTITQMAVLLETKGWQPRWTSLVPIKTDGSKPPFYCVHGVGGNILEFEHFSRYIAPNQPLYGLQAQGLDGQHPRHNSVEEMAAHYIKEIREFQPKGPYFLGGSSFGGLVAFEIARQMLAAGLDVRLVAMIDTHAPGYPIPLPGMTKWRKRANYWQLRWSLHWGNFKAAQGRGKWEYITTKVQRLFDEWGKPLRILKRKADARIARWLHPKAIRQVRDGGHHALRTYQPQPDQIKLTLLRATEQPKGIVEDRYCGWRKYALGGIEVHDVPGHHGSIVREPRVRMLIEKLTTCLDRAIRNEVDLAENNSMTPRPGFAPADAAEIGHGRGLVNGQIPRHASLVH